jgi:hypothetical protein
MKKRRTTARLASRSALVITNATKVAGVAVGVHAGFADSPDSRVIALAAFMMAGAHVSEAMILAVIDQFLGREPEPPDSSKDA